MKCCLTIIGLLTATFLFAQSNDCDSISWSKERKLSWNDFKASTDTTIDDVSLSSIRLQYKWKLVGDTVTLTVDNYFRPCFAWSKVKKNDTLLVHEQGHFNISEYYRRSLIKRFSEQDFKRQNLQSGIQTIYFDISDQQKLFADLYDSKTDFGRNSAMQEEWNNKITGMIGILNEFDKVKITKLLVK